MQVYIGADYKGLDCKQRLAEFLAERGDEVINEGAYEYHEGDDFNDPAIAVAKAVREEPGSFGVLICDSAHGMTIQANRFKGIRAAHCDTAESARLAREHDDANVLCLSAHFMNEHLMREVVEAFLTTNFESIERRVRRINRLDERKDYD